MRDTDCRIGFHLLRFFMIASPIVALNMRRLTISSTSLGLVAWQATVATRLDRVQNDAPGSYA